MTRRLLNWYLPGLSRRNRLAAGGLLLFGLLSRLLWLSYPSDVVFDETYFANFAAGLLRGHVEYDIHPPLGKALISIGIHLFGDHSFGWRIVPAIAGCLTVLLLPILTNLLFKQPRARLLALFLFVCQGFTLVYSRLSLLETFMLLFAEASLICLLAAKRSKKAWPRLLATGLFAGLALSIKWIGAGLLPILWIWWLIPMSGEVYKKKPLRQWLLAALCFIVLPLAVYIGNFWLAYRLPDIASFPGGNYLAYLKWWHQTAWQYNISLTATHRYGSVFWTWPLEIRPVWFYFEQLSLGRLGAGVSGILAIGNPIVWWLSSGAVLLALTVRRYWQRPLVPMLVGAWAVFYLPWSPVHRVLFLYHYFFPAFFSLLLLATFFDQLLDDPAWRDTITLALVLVGLVAIFWLPLWTGLPIPEWLYKAHMWFPSWI